jgi:thioredoxin reductase (NADPH)
MDKKHYQLLIMGSGPAGATAALYASCANLNYAMIMGEAGGLISRTMKIINWPGEPGEVSGMDLMEKMRKQLEGFNANLIPDYIEKIDLTKRPFTLIGVEGVYTCDALIIATGTVPKNLGLPSEKQYKGRGVSNCAICDGFFYKNKDVVVVGGGNSALDEALFLAKIVKSVTVVYRGDKLRGEKWLINQLEKFPNITLMFNSNVVEILGDASGVTGVILDDAKTGVRNKKACEGVFVAVGQQPNTDLFVGSLEMDNGFIKTGFGATSAASIQGVFAAGDVVAGNYRQAIVAAGSGCIATLDAQNFLIDKG